MKQLKVLTATIACLLLAAMVPGCSGEKSDAIVRTVVSERLVAQIDSPSVLSPLVRSPDLRRVAYIAERNGKEFTVVDGIAGKGYDSIWPYYPTFSPDSKRVAYAARDYGEKPPEGNRYFVVVDGEEGEGYERHRLLGPVFSPNSKHVAYVIDADGVYVDRVKVKSPGGTVLQFSLVFSPDSQHLAYVAELGGKQFAVVDGVQGKQYDKMSKIRIVDGTDYGFSFDHLFFSFSPDSQHVAYVAELGGRQFMVVDGVQGEQYDEINGFVFSPDSKHLAYVAELGGRQFMVVDGVQSEQYDGISGFVFSPDSKHLAYVTELGGKQFMVVDGVQAEQYDGISGFVFSPDSNHLAYLAYSEGRLLVIVDGVEEEAPYGSVFSLNFSPDSKRLAYYVAVPTLINRLTGGFLSRSSKSFGFLYGEKGKKYGNAQVLVFSPDSKHVAYIETIGWKACVVIDGIRGERFDHLGRGFIEVMHPGLVWKSIIFDSADSFHYLARKGGSIYLVEETLKQD